MMLSIRSSLAVTAQSTLKMNVRAEHTVTVIKQVGHYFYYLTMQNIHVDLILNSATSLVLLESL